MLRVQIFHQFTKINVFGLAAGALGLPLFFLHK